MHLGRDIPDYRYTLAGSEVPLVDEVRDLGILFDSTLKFHLQTAYVINKANQRLAIIKRVFSFLDIKVFH